MEQNNSNTKTLSPSQMETLSAICDTFLPSIEPPPETANNESVINFFRTSASDTGTPQHVAWYINERLKHPRLKSLFLMLWLLSTRIGTFLLCGMLSLSSQFPYFLSFSEISPEKREHIVQSWAVSNWKFIRIFFTAMKTLILLIFFTKVDDKDENPSWEAIGYCGPDPSFVKPNKQHNKHHPYKNQESEHKLQNDNIANNYNNIEELMFGPLYNGIINLNQPEQQVFTRLQNIVCPVTKHRPSSSSFEIECDAVVVGSGSGGGVFAGVLANSGHRVIVLEKGGYYARTNLSLLEGPTLDKMFLGNGTLMTKDMDVMLLAGSTVGGGSTINWSASIRTPDHVLAEWTEVHGLEMFGGGNYQNALGVVCERMGVQCETEHEGFQNMVLRKGCLELGYPLEDVPRNAPRDHYCGWCTLGCKDGRKKGTAETWLVDLVRSGNGAILPECEALRVLHDTRRALGVEFAFERDGVKHTATIKSKVTIVACGALSTPSLLLNSGLKNPNIGRNLRLHPLVFAWGHFPVTPSSPSFPEESMKSYEGDIMTAMSTVASNVGGTGHGAVIQPPCLHPGLFSVVTPWISGKDFKRRMCRYSRTGHFFAVVRDKGSGEAFSPEFVTYDLNRFDEENLRRAMAEMLRILAAAGAVEIGSDHGSGRVLRAKEMGLEEFERIVKEESYDGLRNRKSPLGSAHQMGSCRMGVDPKTSVVGPTGETWEIEGLFVGDSSVFPSSIGVNPMVTIMAIAYCISHNVLEFLRTHDY